MNQKELLLQGGSAKAKTHVLTADSANGGLFGFWQEYTGNYRGSITPTTMEGYSINTLYTVLAGNPGSIDITYLFLIGDGELPDLVRVTRLDMAITFDLQKVDDGKFGTHYKPGVLFFDEDKGKTIDLIIEPV